MLWKSLHRLLQELPPEHRVFPGHSYGGTESTLYDENTRTHTSAASHKRSLQGSVGPDIPQVLSKVEFYDEAIIVVFVVVSKAICSQPSLPRRRLLKKTVLRRCMLVIAMIAEDSVPTPKRRAPTTVMLAHEAVETGDTSSSNVVFSMFVEGTSPTPTRCPHTTVMLAQASIQSTH